MIRTILIAMLVATVAASNHRNSDALPDHMGQNPQVHKDGTIMTTKETMMVFAQHHASMITAMQEKVALLEENSEIHAEMEAHKADVQASIANMREGDAPQRRPQDVNRAIAHLEESHAAHHAEHGQFHVTHKEAIASFLETTSEPRVSAAVKAKEIVAGAKKALDSPNPVSFKVTSAHLLSRRNGGMRQKKGGNEEKAPAKAPAKAPEKGEEVVLKFVKDKMKTDKPIGVKNDQDAKEYLNKKTENKMSMVWAMRKAFKSFKCLVTKIVDFIKWAGKHIYFGVDFSLGGFGGASASFSLSWGQPLTIDEPPKVGTCEQRVTEKPPQCKPKTWKPCVPVFGFGDSDGMTEKEEFNGKSYCCKKKVQTLTDIFAGECGKQAHIEDKDAHDSKSADQEATDEEVGGAKKAGGFMNMLMRVTPKWAPPKEQGFGKYITKCKGAGIRLVFGLGVTALPPFIKPSFGLGLSMGLLQCVVKISQNVMTGWNPSNPSFINAETDFHEVFAKGKRKIEDFSKKKLVINVKQLKGTNLTGTNYTREGLNGVANDVTAFGAAVVNGATAVDAALTNAATAFGAFVIEQLYKLIVVVVKLVKYVVTVLASTINAQCFNSIGLGAALTPIPFTGFGIEFGTLKCGASLLAKVGDILFAVFVSDPEVLEGDSSALSENEMKADQAKQMKEITDFFPRIKKLKSCAALVENVLNTFGVTLAMEFGAGFIVGPMSDMVACVGEVVVMFLKDMFNVGKLVMEKLDQAVDWVANQGAKFGKWTGLSKFKALRASGLKKMSTTDSTKIAPHPDIKPKYKGLTNAYGYEL